MIDSHCHLADPQFDADTDAVIARALAAGVETMITIADTFEEGEKCVQIAEKYDQLYCTIGVHPHGSKQWNEQSGETLRTLLSSSEKVVAVGEIGLDYHYDNSPRDVQRRVFQEQLAIASECELPVVVHNRESIDDLHRILREVPPEKMVLHCCTEKWENISELIDRGYLLSFTGIATYAKSEDIRNTIAHCPLTQMMVETDAPYLAPDGFRCQRNEPAYVIRVAECIAHIKGIPLEDVERQTTENAIAFFGL